MNPITIPIILTIAFVGIIVILLIKLRYQDRIDSKSTPESSSQFSTNWPGEEPNISSNEPQDEGRFLKNPWKPTNAEHDIEERLPHEVFHEPVTSEQKDMANRDFEPHTHDVTTFNHENVETYHNNDYLPQEEAVEPQTFNNNYSNEDYSTQEEPIESQTRNDYSNEDYPTQEEPEKTQTQDNYPDEDYSIYPSIKENYIGDENSYDTINTDAYTTINSTNDKLDDLEEKFNPEHYATEEPVQNTINTEQYNEYDTPKDDSYKEYELNNSVNDYNNENSFNNDYSNQENNEYEINHNNYEDKHQTYYENDYEKDYQQNSSENNDYLDNQENSPNNNYEQYNEENNYTNDSYTNDSYSDENYYDPLSEQNSKENIYNDYDNNNNENIENDYLNNNNLHHFKENKEYDYSGENLFTSKEIPLDQYSQPKETEKPAKTYSEDLYDSSYNKSAHSSLSENLEQTSGTILINGEKHTIKKGNNIIFKYNNESYSGPILAINQNSVKVKYRGQENWIAVSNIKKIL